MAVKKNTQKILLALYSNSQEPPVVTPVDRLAVVVPDLSPSGFRSLIMFLETKQLIYRQRVLSTVSVGITEEGRRVLTALFPALQTRWRQWQGNWMVLVFLKAPHSDPHFRYLRKLLLSEQSIVFTRGVYLAPDSFSPRIIHECQSLYSKSVSLFSVEKWLMGLDRPQVISYYDLTAKIESYSGISKEIDQLLIKHTYKKGLNNQLKNNISSLFDRLVDSLREDPGFSRFYFPGTPEVNKIISGLQQLLIL